jgi:hypothetical protein
MPFQASKGTAKRTAAPILQSVCGPNPHEQARTGANSVLRGSAFSRVFARVRLCSRNAKESGRQDLNLRPPGPQPGALPDCATPRDASILGASAGHAVHCTWEHMFVSLPENVTRRCGRCGEQKPAHDFAWRRRARGQRDNYCRPCRAAYKQEHYATNRSRYIANAQRRKQAVIIERAEYLVGFLRAHPCADCGEDDPTVLEFDHLRDKRFELAKGIRDRNWQDVLDEIAKCDVVCANCHRRRTARRGRFVRAAVAQWQSLALPRR